MTWRKSDPALLIQARLKLVSPEAAYKELQDYDAHIRENGKFSGNDDLEKLLLARNDKLIDLSLAQFATDDKIVLELFTRACKPTTSEEEENYNHALRLACLSNSNQDGWDWPNKDKWQQLIEPILLKGKSDESHALFSNPSISGKFIGTLLAREGIFKEMPASDWLSAIVSVSRNPRLNEDNSSEHGPDFELWDIQEGILKFLEIAPIDEKHVVQVAHTLLSALNPTVTSNPENDITAIIDRWRKAEAQNYKGEEKDGHHTSLSLRDELLCLIAALYGKTYKDGKHKIIGSANSPDIVMRCAYYGNAGLSVKEMKAGHAKDHFEFTFAALHNDLLYMGRETRAELENHIGGSNIWIYKRHCEQIHQNKKWYDPRPITEYGREVIEDEAAPIRNPDSAALQKIMAQNEALKKRLDNYEAKAVWVVLAIMAIFYFMKH
jgi:hypothetical protein